MVKRDDIIWLAGLLEGEGWFSISQKKYPLIGIFMTNEDVIVKVAELWDKNINRGVGSSKNGWRTQINGPYAIAWMMTLYPFLSKCRRKRIVEIIEFWKETVYLRAPNGMQSMATCHPDRVIGGHGLCRSCYQKEWREKQLLRKVG